MKKLITSLIITFFVFSNSIYTTHSFTNIDDVSLEDLLNEKHPIWQKDSDNDGLIDAIEKILKTDIHKKDTDNDGLDDYVEFKLNLDPTKADSNDDNIHDSLDDFDKDGHSNIDEIRNYTDPSLSNKLYIYIRNNLYRSNIDITPNLLIESCNLVYNTMDYNIIGKTVGEVFPDKYKDLHDFTIVKYTTSDSFSAIALKMNDNTIVAYQATKTYKDWAENFLTQFMPHPQREACIEFIKPLLNKEDKIYITGHSLGGLLTQYASKYAKDEGYTNFKALTFNSANTMNPKHMKGDYAPPIIKKDLKKDYIKSYESILSSVVMDDTEYEKQLLLFMDKSVDNNGFIDISSKKWNDEDFSGQFNNITTNYIITKDPLYLGIGGEYLGNKNIVPSTIITSDDYSDLWNYHSLDNFNGYDFLNEKINID